MNVRRSLSLILLAALAACQPAPVTPPALNAALRQQSTDPQNQSNRFLCVVEPVDDQGAQIKVMDLQSRLIRRVYVPGRILSLEGDRAQNMLYLSVRSGAEQPRFDLYALNLQNLQLSRPASFSQASIQPVDFRVRDQTLFVSGLQRGEGDLATLRLSQGGWSSLARSFPPGQLQWSRNPDQIHSVHFDEENITRTTIDVRQRRIVQRQTFAHGVPFGNNMGLSAPDGDYFYALHQLQGLVAIYAFDIESGSVNRDIATETAVGILYSSALSKDGRFLYATIDNRLERYELVGTQLRRLPPIELKTKEARYLTLADDQRTLYVTHDGQQSVSRIRLSPDYLTFQVDEIPFPGQNTQITVF
jgi:6-phosphogluconolactonase (cycloisomerase 2 family)